MTNEIAPYSDRQLRVIAEIRRIAQMLGVNQLSQDDFDKHHELAGLSTAGYQFGSWNRAVEAAGLEPLESGSGKPRFKIPNDLLLEEVIRLHKMLGKMPSEREMARPGIRRRTL
jgi:hypothetical protein